MMKIMRKHAKIVIWIVVVVFGGGTVVLIWGAGGVDKFIEGLFGREKRGTIASINGESIHFTVFQYYYDQALRQAEKEQGDVDEQTAYQIRDEVWNNMINEMLLNQEANKRGIQVSDAEMYEYLRRYPPRELQEHPAFQTPEGQFDYQKYLQALSDPRVPWNQVEDMIRPNLRMAKLQQSILSLVRVTDEEVERFYRDDNEKVKVEYLLVSAQQFQMGAPPIGEEQIQAYYQDHKDEFKTDPAANLSYVFFEKKPSQADEEETKVRLLEIKEEILAGEDFGELALDYSEDKASAKDSGDLGWFGKGMMVPAFEEIAFALEPEQVSDPVQTRYGWHLIKVEEKRGKDEKQEIKARHILLKVSPSEETLTQLKETADEFANQVNKSNFSQLAEERNLSVSETGWFYQGGFIPGIGRNQQVDEFAFANDEEDISDLLETATGFYLFQIKAKRPAGISPLEEVKQRINRKLVSIQADSLAYVKAEKIYDQVKDGESLKKAAEESKSTYAETDEFSRNSSLPQIGKLPEFIGTAFSLTEPDQISPPVKTLLGTFLIQLLSRTAADDSLFAAAKDSISYLVVQRKQSEAYQNWFAQVKKEADIKDYRSEYFREY